CLRLAGRLGVARLLGAALPGSELITNLRLDWMELMHQLGDAAPKVVQLLGTNDPIVKREDSIDVVQFKNACNLFVPNEDHTSIIDLHSTDEKYFFIRDAITGGERFRLVADASPMGVDNGQPIAQPVEGVVFLVHGIRDYGAWMEPLDTAIGTRNARIH